MESRIGAGVLCLLAFLQTTADGQIAVAVNEAQPVGSVVPTPEVDDEIPQAEDEDGPQAETNNALPYAAVEGLVAQPQMDAACYSCDDQFCRYEPWRLFPQRCDGFNIY